MTQKLKRNHPQTKSCFLERFSGKLNVLTKDGEIKDQNSFKLPVINLTQSRRSNTMKFTTSKQSSQSFFSGSRSLTSKTSLVRNRAEKYLTQNYERQLVDVTNQFMKRAQCKGLKKSSVNHVNAEPLSALPLTKKFRSQRQETHQDYEQKESKSPVCDKIRNSDYQNFLSQLNSVSNSINIKRKVEKRSDKENFNI